MNKIGVIGAGTMGNGIAHVSALSGFDTILMDIKDEFVDLGINTIRKNLERQVKKEKFLVEKKQILIIVMEFM